MLENGQVLFAKTRKIMEGKIFNNINDTSFYTEYYDANPELLVEVNVWQIS